MRVNSFIRHGSGLQKVEIEICLTPGLPEIHIIGLPDTAIRESALRVRTAIRKQGFRLPRAQKVLVYLKPGHVRKSSLGTDLAIAAAVLWETKQIPRAPSEWGTPVLYGQLSLEGTVHAPDDIAQVTVGAGEVLWTGAAGLGVVQGRYLQIQSLRELAGPMKKHLQQEIQITPSRPEVGVRSFSEESARVAAIVAAGEHSLLVAGPPGTGKSTLADSIPCWLEAPNHQEDCWRPIVRPHHTTTKLAMIGGGHQVWAGQIAKAHSGVLILDELLRFDADVQEALREPVERGTLSIARVGVERSFGTRVLLLATTNLCPCGKFLPKRDTLCRCSNSRRQRVLGRLTGPFLDRFAILAFSDGWARGGSEVAATEIHARVERAIRFRRETRGQVDANGNASFELLESTVGTALSGMFFKTPLSVSMRRYQAAVRVARTIADLRTSASVEAEDMDLALSLTWRGHRLLEEWGCA